MALADLPGLSAGNDPLSHCHWWHGWRSQIASRRAQLARLLCSSAGAHSESAEGEGRSVRSEGRKPLSPSARWTATAFLSAGVAAHV